MNILVIGGTRFIGAHVVRQLADGGHAVSVYHRGQHEPELPAFSQDIAYDTTRIRKDLGYRELVPEEEAMKRTVETRANV